jgi:hypothetical protein
MKRSIALLGMLLLVFPLLFPGCSGDDGSAGAPGETTGTVSGTVMTDAATPAIPVADVTVTATAAGAPTTATTTTAADGTYSLANLPSGVYSLTFEKTNFTTSTSQVSILAAVTSTIDAVLTATAPVVLATSTSGTANPGSTLNATVTVTPVDGSTVQSIQWTQKSSVTVTLANADTDNVAVTLPGLDAYKEELFHVIAEPTITPAQLPPNVQVPDEFPEQLQDRFQVQAVNPFQLEEAGAVTLTATIVTTSGTYTKDVAIHANLPWTTSPGLRNVPVNVPVLLHGGTQGGAQATWNWGLSGPAGSSAALDNSSAQNPAFTPDVVGVYTLSESVSGSTIEIFAGNWMGVITRQDGNGRPVAEFCSACHNGDIASDQFTPWKGSGHAEIFGASSTGATANINTSTHYSTSCLVCHTVGFDTAAANGGFDDVPGADGYDAFLAQFTTDDIHFIANANNWDNIVTNFAPVAQLANIQCENCHGPQQTFAVTDPTAAHSLGDPRISLSSDVCGICHGEPARHGRFQQWQVSPHAHYELAIDESDSGNCSRCHTANGFIAWEAFDYDADASVATMPNPDFPADPDADPFIVPWTADEVHPQTCATCHPPHDVGTISGGANNAKMRIEDNTPVLAAGFRVLNVGRGAICMTCHNTRRDLRNDDEGAGDVITAGRAPHGGAQADLLMGQNAFFVTVGVRGKHSLINDTCTNCHMRQTPPPDLLSYNLGGTNHTFLASRDICSECHASITAEEVQSATRTQMSFLAASLEGKLAEMITAYVGAGDNVTLTDMTDPADEDIDLPDRTLTGADTVTVANYADSHGRQAVDVTVDDGVNPPVTGHLQLRRILVNTDNNIVTHLGNGNSGPGETLAKAGWNYLMAVNEHSFGIHNPTFSLQILSGAQEVVDRIEVP